MPDIAQRGGPYTHRFHRNDEGLYTCRVCGYTPETQPLDPDDHQLPGCPIQGIEPPLEHRDRTTILNGQTHMLEVST